MKINHREIHVGINLFAWSLDVLADFTGLMLREHNFLLAMNMHLCISAGLTSTAYLIGLS